MKLAPEGIPFVLIALAGLGSMFVGTLTALNQDDAKRLMSFHVIGQMG